MVWDGFQTSVKLMIAAQAIVLVFALLIAEHHRSGPPVGAAFVYGVRPVKKTRERVTRASRKRFGYAALKIMDELLAVQEQPTALDHPGP